MGNSIIKTYPYFDYSPIKFKCCNNAVAFYNRNYSSAETDDPHVWRWNRVECYTDLIRAVFSMITLLISICLRIH